MKEFTMSMFRSKEDLYKAKSEYYMELVDKLKSCKTCKHRRIWDVCETCNINLNRWELKE